MKPKDQHSWVLITRILSDEADNAEREEFQRWLKKDPANQLFFEELETYWMEEPDQDAVDPAFLFDYESGLQKLRDKLDGEQSNKTVKSKVISVHSSRFMGWKVAASIGIVIVAIAVFAVLHFWAPSVTSYATTGNEQRIINLPDGSKVRLNKNSKITFAEGLSGPKRVITLYGEAFFHVKHNPRKPFIIHVGKAVVQDIGTSFNVKEVKDGNIVVAVKNGIVSFRNDEMNKKEAVILRKNQIGVLKNGHIIKIKHNGIQNYLGWVSGEIVFKKMPFDQVVSQLDHIYGIHCRLADSSLSSLKLTAYIKNTSLSDVLHMIALSLGISYKKQGNEIIWMQKDQRHLQIQPLKQKSTN